jgi:hypothetical protein
MSADREAVIEGLQKLVDALRADERVPLPWDGTMTSLTFYPHNLDGEGFAEVIRLLGGEGWRQRTTSASSSGAVSTWLKVTGHIAGLRVELNANADEVCEAIEPQPVIERHCPALDAVIAEAQEGGTS